MTRILPYIKRKTRANRLPQDFAELLIAEMRAADTTANMELLSNKPAQIDSRPAVRLLVRRKNERGLPLERLIYDILTPKGRLLLIYDAPGRMYFPQRPRRFRSNDQNRAPVWIDRLIQVTLPNDLSVE